MRLRRARNRKGLSRRVATVCKRRQGMFIIVAGLACIGLAVASANRTKLDSGEVAGARVALPSPRGGGFQRAGGPNQAGRLNRARLRPDVRNILTACGDRFEKPGKERLVLTGTITRPKEADSEPHAFRIISELGGALRVEEQVGAQLQVTVFNRGRVLKRNGVITGRDQDLLETLVFDTLDHFVESQANGQAIRMIGSRFRLDGGTEEDYTGPVYELYQVSDHVEIGEKSRIQPKFLYFNTNTLLLDRIHYEVSRLGLTVRAEVELGNWTDAAGQKVPGMIVRKENGQTTLTLAISSGAFAAGASDGIFDTP